MATPMGHRAAALYRDFVEAGGGNVDFSGVIRYLQSMQRN